MFERMIEELKKNPDISKYKMKVKIQKISRFKINVRAGRYKFVLDEDKAIGGTGEDPSPAELLLISIGGCLLSTMN
ncbi:MAG: OsmC family protein [Candidatus Helarchaeota archaeon]